MVDGFGGCKNPLLMIGGGGELAGMEEKKKWN